MKKLYSAKLTINVNLVVMRLKIFNLLKVQ